MRACLRHGLSVAIGLVLCLLLFAGAGHALSAPHAGHVHASSADGHAGCCPEAPARADACPAFCAALCAVALPAPVPTIRSAAPFLLRVDACAPFVLGAGPEVEDPPPRSVGRS